MSLTEEQKAAVALIASAPAEAVAEALKNEANPIYNRIFGAGVTTGKGQLKNQMDAQAAELTVAKQDVERLTGELAEAREAKPDLDKIHQEWQAKLDAAKAETEAERKAREQEREARKMSDLRAHLTGLDPEYARWKATEYAGRLRTKEDGTIELLERPDGEVPVQLPEGKSPFQVLADEIVKSAPAALRISNADTGGGTGGGGGGAKTKDPVEAAIERNRARASAPNALRPARTE